MAKQKPEGQQNELSGEDGRMTLTELTRIIEVNHFTPKELLEVDAVGKAVELWNRQFSADKSEPPTPENVNVPKDLDLAAYLLMMVDQGKMTISDARKSLGTFVNEANYEELRQKGVPRMRRLKQIAEALFEEFHSVYGSRVA